MSRSLAAWETEGRWPFLSLIVINFKRPVETLACLRSIAADGYPGELEVLLVENGSGDGSAEILATEWPTLGLAGHLLVNAENLGFTGGVATGWAEARGDCVCLLNNDAELEPGALAALVEALRGRADLAAVWPLDLDFAAREGVAAATAPDAFWPEGSGTLGVLGNNIWLPLLRGPRNCFVPSGVCLLLPRDLVAELFPAPYFAYFEDVFFGWSRRLEGLALERVPEAVIYHHGSLASQTSKPFSVLLARHAEKNRLANVVTLYSAGTLARLAPLLLLDEAKKGLLTLAALARGDARLLRINLGARAWLVGNLGFLAAQRRAAQAARQVDDAVLLRQMSGRMTHDRGRLADALNALSLGWCRLAGLGVVEHRQSRP